MICDICDYQDCSRSKQVIRIDIDGVRRCKQCRDLIRYGRYIHDPKEAFELDRKKQFTNEWKTILGEIDDSKAHC